ncbi:Zinc finger BED domain-containing protein 5 [Eumeta japonica]|uniref:Zinc finger BED domain-containing protein 5 n=1 Tax=Eumeta variegata TaxID=151549 RepID=A0A4C1VZ23_EUMVA|nr:Zinc finger BED domain-containing protein 5 [Eumeta japonica]
MLMDESTNVAGLAILLIIVRYPYESSFEEDMVVFIAAHNTTGEEVFNKINIFFEENNLSWNDCIDICIDGVKAMTGGDVENAVRKFFASRNYYYDQDLGKLAERWVKTIE